MDSCVGHRAVRTGNVRCMSTADNSFPKGVAAPAIRALNAAGYTELKQLDGVPRAELAALHGMGPKALRILSEALQAEGKSLG